MYLPPRKLQMLLLLLLIITSQAFARGGVSLDEAVERVRDRVGGRVISAETQEWDGQRVHNIRLLTKDGKVKRIRIDGKSGKRMQGRSRR